MTINQLQYIITIAEAGSINKAAEKLFMSQPSLTSALKELEKELGIEIFHRTGRGVTLTNDGTEFLQYARELYYQYESVMQKYTEEGGLKKKFGVSTQHYSFAVKAFTEMVKKFDMGEYDFAIRETKTQEVIDDVALLKSEVGIIYLSDFNRKAIQKILRKHDLEFVHLIDCDSYVYLWKDHPLASKTSINFKDLAKYPNMTFEQGDDSSLFLAEEIFSENEYPYTIRVNDRATMLNLMNELHGYTLCSGIICEELNGDDCIAVPFKDKSITSKKAMEIGYIKRKNAILSKLALRYIDEMRSYLGIED